MGRSGKIVTGLVGLALAIGIILVATHKSNDQAATDNSTTTPPSSTNTTPADQAAAAATITYSSSGFSPNSVTVKSGDSVLIKNTSSQAIQLDSDPHPIHTDDPELNVGVIEPGQSVTIKVVAKGTHGYHNHLDSSQTGKIIVQ